MQSFHISNDYLYQRNIDHHKILLVNHIYNILYSDNELELNENDENLTEFQNLDENDILFEKTLTYIEDNDGQFLDFELLIEKASECTEFKSELISVTIRKIKKSPKVENRIIGFRTFGDSENL